MKKLILALFVVVAVSACGQKASPDKLAIIAEKNFPLTVALRSGNFCSGELSALALKRVESVANAEGESWLDSAKFSETSISSIGENLSHCQKALSLVPELKKQGCYYIYNDLPDGEFLKAAFRQDAEGMNRVIRVYAQGEKPHYAGIDSISFDRGKNEYRNLMDDIKVNLFAESPASGIFDLPLNLALSLLQSNERMDASAFEPMDEGVNAEAARAARKTDWGKYEYSAILVPGYGPNVPDLPLSAIGRQRTKYAASLYKAGKAPFLIVSGGTVHPRLTPYNEAEQMSRYLVEECGVPRSAIFADPHARHTTTNIRNAARIMLRHGFPQDKPALIASSKFQIDYILMERFSALSLKMMLAMPFELSRRVNDNELEFFPLPAAFQINPVDPMDP